MSSDAATESNWFSPLEQLGYARDVMKPESDTVAEVGKRLDLSFCQAAECLYHCSGSVIVTGMGKAEQIGQKISATLASTGTASHWFHPAEAVRGDLARLHPQGVVLIRSQSGETEEVVRLLPWLRAMLTDAVTITAHRKISDLPVVDNDGRPVGLIDITDMVGLLPRPSAEGDAEGIAVTQTAGFGANVRAPRRVVREPQRGLTAATK